MIEIGDLRQFIPAKLEGSLGSNVPPVDLNAQPGGSFWRAILKILPLITVVVVCITFYFEPAHAQTATWSWATSAGGSSGDDEGFLLPGLN